MPILSYIRRLNKCVCMLSIKINYFECLVYIHSLDFALIIYVTKISQFHVSQFWHGTGPILPFVVQALYNFCTPFLVLTCNYWLSLSSVCSGEKRTIHLALIAPKLCPLGLGCRNIQFLVSLIPYRCYIPKIRAVVEETIDNNP